MSTLVLSPDLAPLNANERLHWAAKSVRTAAWRHASHHAAKQARLPHMTAAHVVCTVSFTDNRRRDVHNLYPTAKALIDGLVDAGVLVDDDDTRLIGPDMRRGPKADTVTFRLDITDLGATP